MDIVEEKKEGRAEDICPVCGYSLDECVCCAECGHVCPLEAGLPYCPVCSPGRGKAAES